MKKFLIVLLVLALASMANAITVKLTSGGASAVTVTVGQVITVNASVDQGAIGVQAIAFTHSNANMVIALGDFIAAWKAAGGPGMLVGGDITGAVGNSAGGAANLAANTTFYSFQLTANGAGSVSPFMDPANDAFFAAGDQFFQADTFSPLTVSIVPEPMTIALLGLGGLFLRRKQA